MIEVWETERGKELWYTSVQVRLLRWPTTQGERNHRIDHPTLEQNMLKLLVVAKVSKTDNYCAVCKQWKIQTICGICTVWYPQHIFHVDGSVGCTSNRWSGGCGFGHRRVGNILWWRLVMQYFPQSFSPFGWFKKGSCQFLVKECAHYWLKNLDTNNHVIFRILIWVNLYFVVLIPFYCIYPKYWGR